MHADQHNTIDRLEVVGVTLCMTALVQSAWRSSAVAAAAVLNCGSRAVTSLPSCAKLLRDAWSPYVCCCLQVGGQAEAGTGGGGTHHEERERGCRGRGTATHNRQGSGLRRVLEAVLVQMCCTCQVKLPAHRPNEIHQLTLQMSCDSC